MELLSDLSQDRTWDVLTACLETIGNNDSNDGQRRVAGRLLLEAHRIASPAQRVVFEAVKGLPGDALILAAHQNLGSEARMDAVQALAREMFFILAPAQIVMLLSSKVGLRLLAAHEDPLFFEDNEELRPFFAEVGNLSIKAS
jgi:hypothetical protein